MKAYLITNKANGKKYVGITIRDLAVRWRQHVCDARLFRSSCALYEAIREFGEGSFLVQQIASAKSVPDLFLAEKALIKQHGCIFPDGYNMTIGGQGAPGFRMAEETKKKLSLAHTGKKLSDAHKKKLSLAKIGRHPKRTPEHNLKISESRKRSWAIPANHQRMIDALNRRFSSKAEAIS